MASPKKRSDAESGASSTTPWADVLRERLKMHQECNAILDAAHSGETRRALKLSDDSVSRYPDSAFLYNTRAGVYANAAARARNPATKVQYRKTALECNRRTVELNPNSIVFARHFALALFEWVRDGIEGYDYNDVLDACERAFHLDDPTDPVEDLYDVEGSLLTSDKASRIKDEKDKLIELLEETEKKKKGLLGPGNRKDESQPLINDDFLAETRKEIEALERKKEEIINTRPLDDATHSPEKRKFKNVKKLVSNIETKYRAKEYWNNTMNFEDKRELLKIGIQELKEHFNRKKLRKANELLMEGIDFAKKEKTWKFSVCWCCGERSRDAECNMNHIMNAHLGILSEDLQSVLPEMVPQKIVDMIGGDYWKPVDSIAAAKTMQNASPEDTKSIEWPYSDDYKRAVLIESIRLRFESFIRAKCFASSLLSWSLNLVMTILSLRIPKPVLEYYSLHETILSICFFEVAELKVFRAELEDLINTCALRCLYDLIFGEGKADHEICYARERIVFSTDFSHLIFDERYLRGDISEPDDGTAVISSSDHRDEDAAEVPTHADTFVDWLWSLGARIEEELETWTCTRDASRNRGMEFFQILLTEYERLQRICKRKCEIVRRAEPLLSIKEICREERKKWEKVSGYEPQSCRSLLLKLQKELEEEGDSVTDSGKFELKEELNLIRSILQKAQDDVDSQTERTRREILKLDAIIMVTKAGMRRTGLELAMLSTCDDRLIMVPLLKSFMQARLLDQVEKDATEKANAASEALLAELSLDAEQNTEKSGSGRGKGQKTSKDKKKKPFYRNPMDSKATGDRKKQPRPQYDLDQAFRIRNYNLAPEVAAPLGTEEFEKQEEQAWVEAEEGHRKLEEALEFQRKVENEAKQKRLAEQNKISVGTSTENVVEAAPAVSSEAGEAVSSSQLQQSHSGVLPLNVTEDVPAISREEAEDVSSSEQQQQQSQSELVVPPSDAEGVPAISSEDADDIGSCVLPQQQQSHSGVAEDVPAIPCEEAKDIGSSIQQQQSHSGVAQDVPAIPCEEAEDIGSSVQQQQQQQGHSGLVPLDDAADVSAISFEDAEVIGSSVQQQQQQQQSQSRPVPLNVAEDVPAISCEEAEDVGSSEQQQQQSQSGLVPPNDTEDVPAISGEEAEDVGSSEQQQQQSQSRLVPPNDAEDMPAISCEDADDICSSVQPQQPQQSHSGLVPLNVAEDVPAICYEDTEDIGSGEQQQQIHSRPVPMNVAEATSPEDSEDIGSSKLQEQARQYEDSEDFGSSEQQPQQSHSGPVPMKVTEATSPEDGEDIGSSKLQEQPRHSEDTEDTEDIGSSEQQQSHSGPEPMNVAEAKDGEDIGSSKLQEKPRHSEDTEDIGSSEQKQSHSGPEPMNVAEAKDGEDIGSSKLQEQLKRSEDTEDIGSSEQQQSHSGPVPMNVAEATSSEDGEDDEDGEDGKDGDDIDSRELQEGPRKCGIITVTTAMRVPSVSSSEAAEDVCSWQSGRINVKVDLCLTCLAAMFGRNFDYPEINISQSTHESKRQEEDNERHLDEQNESTDGADAEKHHKTGEEAGSSQRRQQQESQTGDKPLPYSGIRYGSIECRDVDRARELNSRRNLVKLKSR